ncbi:hypothetical protein LO762_29210 [Actinocorallia sp. API 0066]|uniref:hypothetical protein n=1 Tax=Actinocorallia sp. API 0066 TaxID=2896846 RepID=UPI001E2FC8C0|nr:hypothetical protein [Actinocorallia sp. API 0066]MCD0453230.1 hypothetical protein [Actinocorallia sp. API 0066]
MTATVVWPVDLSGGGFVISGKHLLWLGGGVAVIYAMQSPDGAAALLNSTASGIAGAAGSIATFLNGIAS